MNTVATKIDLWFNPAKCASLTFQRGRVLIHRAQDLRRQCQGAPRGPTGGLPGHHNRCQTSLPPRDRPPPENEQTEMVSPGALAETRHAKVPATAVTIASPGFRESGEIAARGTRRPNKTPAAK
ncbi:hypothetical protein ElyMa_006849500 [Elysia marginata]|uniref:Uncharacterized protein n=1 Tax=Elysia marginata TaxID=1093978 RepID=A0AAV4J9H5_9GAST|nr:hypothetical protein ElyMa_006849500 [Elysia marginata]